MTISKPVTLEEALDIAQQRAFEKRTPSFPPVEDTVAWFNSVDWAEVRERCRGGFNNCGIVIAIIGERLLKLGVWMADV